MYAKNLLIKISVVALVMLFLFLTYKLNGRETQSWKSDVSMSLST